MALSASCKTRPCRDACSCHMFSFSTQHPVAALSFLPTGPLQPEVACLDLSFDVHPYLPFEWGHESGHRGPIAQQNRAMDYGAIPSRDPLVPRRVGWVRVHPCNPPVVLVPKPRTQHLVNHPLVSPPGSSTSAHARSRTGPSMHTALRIDVPSSWATFQLRASFLRTGCRRQATRRRQATPDHSMPLVSVLPSERQECRPPLEPSSRYLACVRRTTVSARLSSRS